VIREKQFPASELRRGLKKESVFIKVKKKGISPAAGSSFLFFTDPSIIPFTTFSG